MNIKRNLVKLGLLGAWLLALPAVVQAQLTFTTNNGAITITGYSGSWGAVVVPNAINGYPVTSIGYQAFYNLGITSVTIPNSVTSIGTNAFGYCFALTNVIIGSGVIGRAAFSWCHSLTSVTIGNSVTSIGDWAFLNGTSLTRVMIPNSVTNIGSLAFDGCTALTNVTIGNSVASIGDSAFGGAGLTSVTIPNSVTSIGSAAFSCPSLTRVTIPNSVTNIGSQAFSGCTALTNVTIGNGVTSIPYGAFAYCASLPSVTIPNNVTSIGDYAFYDCYALTTVTIGGGVASIGSQAFAFDSFIFPLKTVTVFFLGNAPGAGADTSVFNYNGLATIYYLPGKTGWHSPFDGLPAFPWNPLAQTSGTMFGVRTNRFGFNISGSSNLVLVVEACTNFANPVWLPVSTNTLNTFIGTNGTSYFSDPKWTNYRSRFYRLRSP
jgi:hypothetical protein